MVAAQALGFIKAGDLGANLTKYPILAILYPRCELAALYRINFIQPIREARGTSPLTARQPPGEKGAKACTIGIQPVSRRVFLRLFFGRERKKGAKYAEKSQI